MLKVSWEVEKNRMLELVLYFLDSYYYGIVVLRKQKRC